MHTPSRSRTSTLKSQLALSCVAAGLVLSLACSKPAEAPPQAATEEAATDPSATPSGKRKNFGDMTKNEKIGYMKEAVMPEMKALWAGAGQKVDNFSCKTCHGSGATNGSFEMPSADLPKLDVSDGFADEKKEHPEMVQFMMEKVGSTMAALIDKPPYDPATHEGFGCFGCHTMAEASAAK